MFFATISLAKSAVYTSPKYRSISKTIQYEGSLSLIEVSKRPPRFSYIQIKEPC